MMTAPQFVNPFTCDEHLNCLQCLPLINKAAWTVVICISFCEHLLSFLLVKYPKVKFQGDMVSVCLTF